MAAGRRRGGVGDFSLQDHPVDLHIRVGLGHCGEQCLRIGVEGVCKQFIGFTELHHPAQVHDHDPVGNVAHHTQGVGDKQICQVIFLLHLLQQIDDLGLNGHIQGGNRFVADHHLGLEDERPGNANPLPLAAGEGVGIPAQERLVETYLFGDPVHGFLDLPRGHFCVVAQRFTDDVKHRHPGIQAGIGVLKDHLNIPPVFLHLLPGRFQKVNYAVLLGVQQNLTG